ncbi:MAG: hypothetical protein B6I24_10420 [Bacteroidetes bacterium 4572_128]|nr:MAG: hypothetical protein B6I24_10420 [Bacteroidetes bacterium 4572_128]
MEVKKKLQFKKFFFHNLPKISIIFIFKIKKFFSKIVNFLIIILKKYNYEQKNTYFLLIM